MKYKIVLTFLIVLFFSKTFAQVNVALGMSESFANAARFNPSDNRQLEIIRDLKPSFLISKLNSDQEKNAFWLNIYNGMMLTFLRDTSNQGLYKNFYKLKNVVIAGRSFSLFDIEHEFLFGGRKMKSLRFKKSKLLSDTSWRKLMPFSVDKRVLFCMYRGLYSYPPFQVVENGDLSRVYLTNVNAISLRDGNKGNVYDWVKPYSEIIYSDPLLPEFSLRPVVFTRTPLAVHIKNFYPKYEGVIFKEEEENPWLKK